MADDLQEYTNYVDYYLRNTLGVSSVLDDGEVDFSAPSVTMDNHWVFVVENLDSYQDEERSLLYKMINAVGLKEADFMVTSMSSADLVNKNPDKIFFFKDEPNQPNETYSPRILNLKSALKRKAWDDMKKFFGI